MIDEELQEQLQFEGLIQGLIQNDYGYCIDFILPEIVVGLNANIQTLLDAEKMKISGIGNNFAYQKDKNIRGDKINWIELSSVNTFELVYLKKIEKFILYLNKTCFTAINCFESHYANYETNSFYKRHVDQFKNEGARQFSILLYLNDNWLISDGGMLALYPTGKDQIHISPLGGSLVLFRSAEMEHEVLPSLTRERRSIAAWLKC
ncbi:2OG-Fe(II) oxygenase [Putridiphycobacter roseus]|uniref:2OG-Fe(II) oxygenase n=1 Tax=Putridiphycobacter roseus TaxID=2219161 RepID=A0A2W1NG31_9FLAO|nr:2OG-Fe(II) oxygenase [Putridiphycobacter roseus]PZE18053.1 2OG-Fe(II) oxygenase [Putridiphycobacter roseus]